MRGGLPCPFSIIGKKCPSLWKKNASIVVIYCCHPLWPPFKMQYLRVSRQKNQRFFPCGAFLSCVVDECLSKCPNSKKTPLPSKIPGYAPGNLPVLGIYFYKRVRLQASNFTEINSFTDMF